jgi:hypothetical protein
MKSLAAAARVLGLTLVLLSLGVALVARRAEAQVVEGLRGFGEQLAGLGVLSPHSAPRRLVVNDLEFGFFTLGTKLNVHAALDRFKGLCRTAGKVDLPAAVRQKLEAESPGELSEAGVLRNESERDGFLACLDFGQNTSGEALLTRLVEFGRTRSLRSLGQVRYVMARRGNEETTLVVLWSEGEGRLDKVFPKSGDAPGRDLEGVARPSGSARLLSAAEVGMPFGLAVYRVDGTSAAAVKASYGAQLAVQGWRVQTRPGGILVAHSGQRTVLVHLSNRRRGGVLVSLSDLG